jgi:hypothetical protein
VPPARIRIEAEARKQDVTMPGSEDLWIIQPLLDAGLDLDAVRDLLFRVSFDCLVTSGPDDVDAFVRSQPTHLRAAWIETVDRMLRVPEPSTGS